ncbi:hypothetical protein [Kitasatospora cheerisanensis]|uniref:Uncharacterized protein n=1 Tax=Kitasatospora cheerisanensis KCTC 2395 TaxID=1348663 RepID=A0A066YT62_9ACTN|nr:hypothetical protein [Kitasatospora cheerisanensis]KDN81120.1 hypothetical protein KCH_72140 [Kitasatospora cheerisanensis KCTC 2395]
MEVLRGSYRVHFVAAWVLCGIELLCLAATAPPLRWVAPVWLWASTFGAIVLVVAAALARSWSVPFLRRGSGFDLVQYMMVLPRGLKICYVVVACLLGLGLATAGGAEDVHKDSAGYYWTKREAAHRGGQFVRVDITRDECERRRGAQVRIFTGIPAVFALVGSFLVLASAETAYGTAVTAARAGSGARRRRA